MKKITRTLAGIVCVMSVLLAGAENLDGTCNLTWTLGWLAAALASGLYLKKMEGQCNG